MGAAALRTHHRPGIASESPRAFCSPCARKQRPEPETKLEPEPDLANCFAVRRIAERGSERRSGGGSDRGSDRGSDAGSHRRSGGRSKPGPTRCSDYARGCAFSTVSSCASSRNTSCCPNPNSGS
jgi:hypothetical protein